jgi:2-polyprenyl-3-methyl-5-hydroxy-6-metoxy-1,4-benzoquinol methylase
MTSDFDFVKNALISTTFGKTIKKYIAELEKTPGYYDIANKISHLCLQYLDSFYDRDEAIENLKKYYVEWVYAYLKEYLNFKRNFQYSAIEKGFKKINQDIYQNFDYMKSFLISLFISHAVFPHHYKKYLFFKSQINNVPTDAKCIDFGSGHGLFSLTLLEGSNRTIESIDISPVAVSMTEFFLKALKTENNKYICTVADATSYNPIYTDYDFFVCAEFLEHIEKPQIFLKRMLKYVKDNGKIFVVLPINEPSAEHLIHFKNLDDVENFLNDSGLHPVIKEIIPTEPVTVDEAITNKVPTNYLCICQKL